MKNFALIGAAGFIAPRHMRAIKETGNNLVCALDPNDSVGIIDSYFPDADFFTEPERFDRHLDKLRRQGDRKIDYVSICSPNYLHDAHIRMALRNGAHAICEKPIVLNPWNIEALQVIEKETGLKIYTILQLRHHPAIIALKEKVEKSINSPQPPTPNPQSPTPNPQSPTPNPQPLTPNPQPLTPNPQPLTPNPQNPTPKTFDIELTYITSRGAWYHRSWKGDIQKSGGVATNIGVHFFDMLTWIFGCASENIVYANEADHASGFLQLEHARVNWFLSVNRDHLPETAKAAGKTTYRSLKMDGKEIEFSDGFTDLHTVSYQKILEGNGYGLGDAKRSIEIVHKIRNNHRILSGARLG